MLCGCNSARYGGAPEQSFDVDKDLRDLAENFSNVDSIKEYYEKAKEVGADNDDELRRARDKFITARLTMMNIRYIQFIRKSTSDKQLLDSAVDILGIGLNIAGVSFNSAATKTALAAAAAGVTGSKATIEKNFYFEETIPALVAAMNAQRKKVLARILEGMAQKDIKDYPFEQAVTDLHSYYFAGTFIGAIHVIQTDAGVKEQKEDGKIVEAKKNLRKLRPLTEEQKKLKKALSVAIGNLIADDIENVNKALKLLEGEKDFKREDDLEKACDRLQDHVIQNRLKEVEEAFIKVGVKY